MISRYPDNIYLRRQFRQQINYYNLASHYGNTRYHCKNQENRQIAQPRIKEHTKGVRIEYNATHVPWAFAALPRLYIDTQRIDATFKPKLQHYYRHHQQT